MTNLNGPKKPGSKIAYQVSLLTLVMYYINEFILPYGNNRGAKGVSKARVLAIANNFNASAFGLVSMVDLQDGSNRLADAHHRMDALVLLYTTGRLTTIEANTKISVEVHHRADLYELYLTLNTAKAHTGQEKITNPDTAVGAFLTDAIKKSGVSVSAKHYQNLADVVLAAELNGPAVTIESVFKTRTKVTALLNEAAAEQKLKISVRVQEQFVSALRSYAALVNGVKTPFGKRVANSPGFVLTFFSDFYSNEFGGFSRRGTKKLIQLLDSGKAQKVYRYTKTVARRNGQELEDIKLYAALN